MIEYFKILELEIDATEKDLKDSFRRLSKKYHPDTNQGSDKYVENFRLVHDAYERLLVFMKSNNFESWKKNHFKSKKQTEENKYSSEYKEQTHSNFSNNQKEKSKSEHFNYYEFVNDYGLFEEDLFEENITAIKKQYSLNEVVTTENFEYKILRFQFVKEFGNQIFKSKSDGYFLIVELEIKNISKTMISLHNYMYRIFDYEGYFYEFSINGLSTMNFLQEPIIPFFGKEQNPRIKSTIKLIFEIPEIGDYFIQLCGGKYEWDNNNICICNEISTVKLVYNQ